jgi:Tfp pilus assembly protein PilF
LLRVCLLAGLLPCCLATAGRAADATGPAGQSLVVNLSQALPLAQAALRSGKPKLALRLSEGMLKADATDGQAHYLRALALRDLQAERAATRAAGRAYRHARTDD